MHVDNYENFSGNETFLVRISPHCPNAGNIMLLVAIKYQKEMHTT